MRTTKTKKLLALFLALVMLVGSALPVFAAEATTGTTDSGAGTNVALQELSDEYSLMNYEEYKKNKGINVDTVDGMRNKGVSVTVPATEYLRDEEYTTADITVDNIDNRDCIIVPQTGKVSWKVQVPKTGLYCVRLVYRSTTDDTMDIERIFTIDGKAPYQEARYQSLHKTWTFKYLSEDGGRTGAFKKDPTENELRPEAAVVHAWTEFSISDVDGYYTTPLEFLLNEKVEATEDDPGHSGEVILTLEGVRDEMAIAEVGIYTYESAISYADYIKGLKDAGKYTTPTAAPVKLEAELPVFVSHYTIYPVYDRSSPLTSPQDSVAILRNTIGADKWVRSGQWIKYGFKCEESGMYQIGMRFMQDTLKGMYSSRAIKINGQYLFEEAKNLQFGYKNAFQYDYLTDGDQYFEFYFEKGQEYTIEFEVVLGSFADVVRQVDGIITSLNDDYLRIMELTGADADVNRDYGLARVMPEVIIDLALQADLLYTLVDFITETAGLKSETTSTLEQAAVLIERMSEDEKEIAANLSSLKSYISSLGTWLSDMSAQFLEVDYIKIVPTGTEKDKAEAGFWSAMWFEIKKFVASFFANYDAFSVDAGDNKLITVWTSSGRDQAQITKNLIDAGFTEGEKGKGVSVNLKLTAGGALLPSILAGVGPDVSIDATSPMEMAIRGAILPLNDYDTFDEVMARFSDSAKVPLSLYGKTYAVPTNQGFSMMFVREDIVTELGLKIPETWDELMSMVPVLQFNNMDIGMSQDFAVFLYQSGGQYWKNEGMAINFDDYQALDAFEYMCNLFTQYSLPTAYDAQNRFKTGEMPVIISSYVLYNTLTVFAPEISGLWRFYQIPGTPVVDENGAPVLDENGDQVINRHSISSISGVIIPKGCKDTESAWKFLDWYSDAEFQIDYCNEMVALLGPSGKTTPANREALKELPWTSEELEVLETCLDETYAIEPFPGDYFVGRYTGFAFAAAYNQGADPSDSLLQHVDAINKELSRKRKEFDLMLNEDWMAIQEYMGFESFDDWRNYWAVERNTTPDSIDCIQDRGGADKYTYVDWMKDHNISAENFADWERAVKYDETEKSYKDWLAGK
ncbi:MAG: extracellular solute-binding protein [Clostridia bacterium]|nr:extracellular solute-binding protein [Clostridia bacterium]